MKLNRGFSLFSILLTAIILLNACGEVKHAEYARTPEKLYYKLCAIGDGQEHPKPGQILQLEVCYKTEKDSVFWDSKNNAPDGYFYTCTAGKPDGNYTDYLPKMVCGDSVDFMVDKTLFFKEVFGGGVPVFSEKDSIVKVNLRLCRLLNSKDYEAFISEKMTEHVQARIREQKQVQQYINKHFKIQIPLADGAYYEKLKTGNGPAIENGKLLTIRYKGFFMDGRLADYTPDDTPFEFLYGDKEQLVPGLQQGISCLRKGDIAKFILPSHLAFGEQGSSTGNIPPYTPLVYEVEIIDVK